MYVHLDPRAEGVAVPAWLRKQPQLVLQIGLDMPIPIPDLRVDDVGVFGTLSFNRQSFACCVPWDAVFAVVGDDGKWKVWPESMPAEIAAEVDREARRTQLRSVPPVVDELDEAGDTGEQSPHSGERRGQSVRPSLAPVPAPSVPPVEAPEDVDEVERPGPLDEGQDAYGFSGSGAMDASAMDSSPPVPAERSRPSKKPQASQSVRPSDPPGRRKAVKLPPYMRVVK